MAIIQITTIAMIITMLKKSLIIPMLLTIGFLRLVKMWALLTLGADIGFLHFFTKFELKATFWIIRTF